MRIGRQRELLSLPSDHAMAREWPLVGLVASFVLNSFSRYTVFKPSSISYQTSHVEAADMFSQSRIPVFDLLLIQVMQCSMHSNSAATAAKTLYQTLRI